MKANCFSDEGYLESIEGSWPNNTFNQSELQTKRKNDKENMYCYNCKARVDENDIAKQPLALSSILNKNPNVILSIDAPIKMQEKSYRVIENN